jgi:hypothetical protein
MLSRRGLSPLCLPFHHGRNLVAPRGFEPASSRLRVWRPNQQSLAPNWQRASVSIRPRRASKAHLCAGTPASHWHRTRGSNPARRGSEPRAPSRGGPDQNWCLDPRIELGSAEYKTAALPLCYRGIGVTAGGRARTFSVTAKRAEPLHHSHHQAMSPTLRLREASYRPIAAA